MKSCPLKNKPECSWRKASSEEAESGDVDQSFVASVKRMEVGWIVIVPIHLDDNAEKARNLRHAAMWTLAQGRLLPEIYQ